MGKKYMRIIFAECNTRDTPRLHYKQLQRPGQQSTKAPVVGRGVNQGQHPGADDTEAET